MTDIPKMHKPGEVPPGLYKLSYSRSLPPEADRKGCGNPM